MSHIVVGTSATKRKLLPAPLARWQPRWCETVLFDEDHMRFVSWVGRATFVVAEVEPFRGHELIGTYGGCTIDVQYVCSSPTKHFNGCFAYTPRWVDHGDARPALSHRTPPPAEVATYLHHLTDRPFEWLRKQSDGTVAWQSGRVVQHLPTPEGPHEATSTAVPALLLVELYDRMACVPSHHIGAHNWRWDSYLHSGSRPATRSEQLALQAAAQQYQDDADSDDPDDPDDPTVPWWAQGFVAAAAAFSPPPAVGAQLVFADAPAFSAATRRYEWAALDVATGVRARAAIPAGTLFPYLLNTGLLDEGDEEDAAGEQVTQVALRGALEGGGVSQAHAGALVARVSAVAPLQQHMMAAWRVRNARLGEDVNCCCVRIPADRVLQPFYYAQVSVDELPTGEPSIPYLLVLEDVAAGTELLLPEGERHAARVSALTEFTYTSHLRAAYDQCTRTLTQAAAGRHPYPHPRIAFPANWWHLSPAAPAAAGVPCVVQGGLAHPPSMRRRT